MSAPVPFELAPMQISATRLNPPPAQALALAENPGYPVFFIDITRPKDPSKGNDKLSFTILPTSFKYTSSVRAADRLEFTVPDPYMHLIESPFLQEDLKTFITFRFGFANVAHMSDPTTMVFFRQAPSFPANGTVETTLVAYDKGIFLALPVRPKVLTKKGNRGGEDALLTFKEVIQFLLDDINDLFKDTLDQPLQLDTDGLDFEGRYFRMAKPAGSVLEYLLWLRQFAQSEKNPERVAIEVFVRDNKLFFRPAQKRVQPIAVYSYGSPIDGEKLLSFQPEVNLQVNRKTVADVDPTTGETTETVADAKNTNRPRLTQKVASSSHDRQQTVLTAGSRVGDAAKADTVTDVYQVEHTWKKGETLESIAGKYGVTPTDVCSQNPSLGDCKAPTFTPGMVLKIRTENKNASNKNVTPENRLKAALSFVMEEDEGVRAKATVIGDPRLLAGWPIVIRNVGRKWEGLWYIDEVEHDHDNGGYLCNLSLTRDGFMFAEEMESGGGSQVLETPALDAAAQQKQQKEKAVVSTNAANRAQRVGR